MSRSQCTASSLRLRRERWPVLLLVTAAMAFAAPSAFAVRGGNGNGNGGSGGSPGPSTQKVTSVKATGTVINSLTGAGIANAIVTYTGATGTYTETTDSNGGYFFKSIPADVYSVKATTKPDNPYFDDATVSNVNLQKGGPAKVVNLALTPLTNVVVSPAVSGDAVPDATLTLSGSCMPLDGSSVQSETWTQEEDAEGMPIGVPATVTGSSVQLGDLSAYKAALVEALKSPPITKDQLPPELQDRFPALEGDVSDFAHGIQDRWQVAGINPFAEEKAAIVPLTYTCTTSSGSYSASVDVTTTLPWAVSTGLRTVPMNVGVLLYGKCGLGTDPNAPEACTQEQWNWTGVDPNGDPVQDLADADTQTPWFTPDQQGEYLFTETISGTTLDVYAGKWRGAIDPDLTLASVEGDPIPGFFCRFV